MTIFTLAYILLFFSSPFQISTRFQTVLKDDIIGYPVYETNGEGLNISREIAAPRLKEISDFESPEMPDEEPEILLKMQEKLSNVFTFPHSLPFENTSYNDTKIESFKNNRFTEESNSESRIPIKQEKNDKESWETAQFISAWASSVFTYRKLETDHNYPAMNAIHGFSYWCSTGDHPKDQLVSWEGSFEIPKRIHHIWIRWAYAPGSYRIETTSDGLKWVEKTPWKTGFKGVQWQWLAKIFWWWRWYYKSYAEQVLFEEPIWALKIRIIMKESVFNFFGIYKVEAWIKQWTVMLKSLGESSDSDSCLITADGRGINGRELQLMDCTEAISTGDGRELWIVQNDFQIVSYVGSKCIETLEGDTSENARIQINDCWLSNSVGDGRDKWLIEPNGRIKLYKDETKCMTALTNMDIEDVGYRQKTMATTTIDDGQHNPSMAVDGNDNTFWLSSPGIKENNFIVIFGESKTLREIIIKWKYAAKEFEVMGLNNNGVWEIIHRFHENKNRINNFILGSRNFFGIKIIMYETSELFDNKLIYGIISIQCKSGTKAVRLKSCSEGEDTKSNRFLMEDVDFIDLTGATRLEYERNQLNDNTNKLIGFINKLTQYPITIYKLIEKSESVDKLLNQIESKLSEFEVKLGMLKEKYIKKSTSLTIGSNSNRPARDCIYIHKAFPHKSNGYYWIKSSCTPNSIRVYCDFSVRSGSLYFYHTLNKENKIHDIKDLQYECSKIGLNPLEIFDYKQIETINQYLEELAIEILPNEVVPIGYDWSCLQGSCSGRFKSLNSETSIDITESLLKYIDKSNVLNLAFNLRGYIKDSIGYGTNRKMGLIFFKTSDFNIKGVLCSTNTQKNDDYFDFIKADCFTTIRGNPEFEGIQNTHIKVLCPLNCAEKIQAKIYGTSIYKDDSSICRAAVHSGVLNPDLEGKIQIEIQEGIENYEGSLQNGVLSESFERMAERSFSIKENKENCPIDKFKFREKNNFLQIKEKITFFKKKKNLISFLEKNEFIIKKIEKFNNIIDINKEIQNVKLKNVEPQIIRSKILTTEDAIQKLEHILNHESETLKKHLKLVKDSDILIKELTKLLDPMLSKALNSDYISERLEILQKHVEDDSYLISELIRLAQIKLRQIERENKKLHLEKLKILKFDQYSELYTASFSEMYEIFDHPKALNGPSHWSFVKNNLKGHSNSISQTSNIKCLGEKSCTSSLLILKYKQYYDGKFQFSVLLRDNDIFGAVFRYINPFNYYVFEMRQQGRGWKRLRIVRNGISSEISYVEDGGFLQNIWYKVLIIFRADYFEIRMADEELNLPLESMPLVLQGENQEISKGRVGFLVNGMEGIYIDNFIVKPLDCILEYDLPDIRYLPPECSRFKETYYGQMNMRWSIINPNEMMNGPSIWEFVNGIFGKEKVIYQKTNIYSTNPNKIGSFAILNFDKICSNGVIMLDFYPENNGVIGIAIKFKNPKFFYVFEIGGEEEKFIQMRKVIDGKYTTLSRNETIGYQINQWHKLSILMKNNVFKLYFSNIGEAPVQIFEPIENHDINEGTIALSTFKTKAAFDNIHMIPLSDWLADQKMSFELNNEDGELSEDDDNLEMRKRKIGTEPSEFNKIQWNTCLAQRTPELKNKYCKHSFKDEIMLSKCGKNFCETCCESFVDWLHPLHRYHCKQQCQELSLASDDLFTWNSCIEAPKPKQSIYEYCDNTFDDQKLMEKCKLDSCKLCCVTSQEFKDTIVKAEVVSKCEGACFETFSNKIDIIID